ncbi:MAG: hypothetical protein ABIQ99_14720 [Thermoflexales bacterium]
MLNTHVAMALLDRGVTLNWDDGATLHKITAQARYHTQNSASIQTLRIGAQQKVNDEPLTLTASDSALEAHWTWSERDPGWSALLVVRNKSESDLFIDALEVIRVDSAFGGVFGLGAPTGLWRCAREGSPLDWEAWSDTAASAGGFVRPAAMLIQPPMSNRSQPPALLVRALGALRNAAAADDETGLGLALPPSGIPTELRLELSGERFERFAARSRADGLRLAPGVAVASAEFWIIAGDDAAELLALP